MNDKIKRYDLKYTKYGACVGLKGNGVYVLYTDHQAAMREAVEVIRALRNELAAMAENERSDRPESYDSIVNADAFLSAHQECGGGST